MSETLLANEEAARTATGEIKNQSQPLTPETEKPIEPKPEAEGKSLLNEKGEEQKGAPEKYETFNVPEGFALDEAVATEAGAIFKEMNLSQDQAQKLVDFYSAKTRESAEAPIKFWQEMQEKWKDEIKNDPNLGPKLQQVRANTSKAIDMLGPELASSFREAMDYTGAGNHPAFIRGFNKFAEILVEGSHVSGAGPSPHGQKAPGAAPASAAKAMYPTLP